MPWQAYAKLHGTYESINGGSVGEALVDLTGGCCEKISFTSGKWLMGGREQKCYNRWYACNFPCLLEQLHDFVGIDSVRDLQTK